jgi:signal transduction histidine kinase
MSAAQWRLIVYIRFNVVAIVLAIACLVSLRLTLVRSPWMDVLALLLVLLAGCLLVAHGLVPVGRIVPAVVLVAVANWLVVLAITTMVPVTLLICPVTILVPTLLAVSYLDSRDLPVMLGGTVTATLATSAAGMLSPGVGLESLAPPGVLTALKVTFIPIATALGCIIAWQSHLVMRERARALRDSAERLVAAADGERRRIERDLHDGAQQRLVAVAMQLRVLQRVGRSDQHRAEALIDRLVQDVQQASAELRHLSHGIYPPQLTEQGLAAALHSAALRVPLPVTVDCDGVGRYPPLVESAVYFTCLEGLQNAVKHAGPGVRVRVALKSEKGLTFDVRDEGVGCDPATLFGGHGLRNIRDRIGAIGGTLTAHAEPGGGVHLHGHVPAISALPTTAA